ncbi:MAG: HDOD domain-containing protein [Desulfobacterium sp.]|nr:HDOD domain-containing protein [Desulfobacterium sp.]
MERKRILFVDDNKNLLEGLKRMLRGMRKSWKMRFAEGGEEALCILGGESFDIIVTDMRMPVMSGLELLEKVKVGYPHMARVILSGHTDQDQVLKSTCIAHQFLAKPSDVESLKACVLNLCDLQATLDSQVLKDLIADLSTLPSIPSAYQAIMEEISCEQGSLKRVGKIIEQDLSMTTKILHLVNSAFFGLPRKITNPSDAANLLGIDIIRSLVLAIGVFSQFKMTGMKHFSLDDLFAHGVLTGSHAMKIARAESLDKEMTDSICMAGLLHDLGKVVLAQNFQQQYDDLLGTVADGTAELAEIEKQVFGASHGEVGGYLLGLWGFPPKSCHSVVFHHDATRFADVEFGAVYAANFFAHQCCDDLGKGGQLSERDHAAITGLELLPKFEFWETICCRV